MKRQASAEIVRLTKITSLITRASLDLGFLHRNTPAFTMISSYDRHFLAATIQVQHCKSSGGDGLGNRPQVLSVNKQVQPAFLIDQNSKGISFLKTVKTSP